MSKTIQIWIAIALGVIALSGAGYKGFCYFAPAQELAAVSKRLDIKILTDQRDYVQRRIWEIEDRYKYGGMPSETSEQLRELKLQLIRIDRELLNLSNTGG